MRVLSFVLVILLGSACTSDRPAEETSASPSESSATAPGQEPPPTAADQVPPPDPACDPAPGREVEVLDDVTAPAVTVEPVVDPDSGDVLADGFTIPAQVVDTGCIVRFDAPGGCLGAVAITGATIPEATIPETVADGQVYPSITVPAVSEPAVQAEQVCQVKRDGDFPGVTRAGVVRPGFSRDGAARPGDDVVATVRLEPVRLPDVDVEPERLETRRLTGTPDVDVLEGESTTSYVAPAGVLFDTDQAVLRPEALAALREIARTIRTAAPGRSLLIEGHTDDTGAADYDLDLSERRATAVADWLVDEQGFDRNLVATRGYGDTQPAYPNNNDANRARNRRVVITVLP